MWCDMVRLWRVDSVESDSTLMNHVWKRVESRSTSNHIPHCVHFEDVQSVDSVEFESTWLNSTHLKNHIWHLKDIRRLKVSPGHMWDRTRHLKVYTEARQARLFFFPPLSFFDSAFQTSVGGKRGWRRIGCLNFQVSFHKRATYYRALLRKWPINIRLSKRV